VVWADNRFRSGGSVNDIVILHSPNATGTTWSSVARVPMTPPKAAKTLSFQGRQ
jgi:hypothetical protein